MAGKKNQAKPNLNPANPQNPQMFPTQAIEVCTKGQLVRGVSWPAGQFLAKNQVAADTDLESAAFSVVLADGAVEPWVPSCADMIGQWERHIPAQ